jgi:hypothetical protein
MEAFPHFIKDTGEIEMAAQEQPGAGMLVKKREGFS